MTYPGLGAFGSNSFIIVNGVIGTFSACLSLTGIGTHV